MTRAPVWNPLRIAKSLSRTRRWSLTESMPGRPMNALATTSYLVGSDSFTRKDSGIWSGVMLPRIGASLNCSENRSYASAEDS